MIVTYDPVSVAFRDICFPFIEKLPLNLIVRSRVTDLGPQQALLPDGHVNKHTNKATNT